MKKAVFVFLSILVSVVLMGCVGKKNILFVTKTSIAVDIDANPSTFDIGYGRYEGSIAPVVESGQVLPLITSVSSDQSVAAGIFGSGISQNFGVGNAAVIMSRYVGSDKNLLETYPGHTFEEIIENQASVEGSINENKRYFFGTKTNVGFATTFSTITGYVPESISLGYKRKEMAYVPIRENKNKLHIPSLIATAGNSASAGSEQAEFSVSQFYATGMAANFLAAHPAIRNSVIASIIGDDELEKEISIFNKSKEKQNAADKLAIKNSGKAKKLIDAITDDAEADKVISEFVLLKIAPQSDFDGISDLAGKKSKLKRLVSPGDSKNNMKVGIWLEDKQK